MSTIDQTEPTTSSRAAADPPAAGRRRRVRLAVCTVLAGIALVAGGIALAPRVERAARWWRVRRLEGQELQALDAEAQAAIVDDLRALWPGALGEDDEVTSAFPLWMGPGLVARLRTGSGRSLWAVVLVQQLVMIPGDSRAAVLLVNDGGDLRNELEDFSTGWRIRIDSVGAERHGARVDLVIETSASMGGGPCARQVLALIEAEDRVALVRAEAADGTFYANSYRHPNHTLGPRVRGRDDAASSLAGLASPDPVRRLEVLVWLGGDHAPVADPDRASVLTETVTDSEAAAAVCASPRARELVEALVDSADPWTAEAAAHALAALASPETTAVDGSR